MPFKPNYKHQRAERDRLKQEKKEAKLRDLEQAATRRKDQQHPAASDEPSTDEPRNP